MKSLSRPALASIIVLSLSAIAGGAYYFLKPYTPEPQPKLHIEPVDVDAGLREVVPDVRVVSEEAPTAQAIPEQAPIFVEQRTQEEIAKDNPTEEGAAPSAVPVEPQPAPQGAAPAN